MATPSPHPVVFAEIARSDLQSIVAFIATDNPLAAAQVLDQIERRVASLRTLPERGRVVPELAAFGCQTYRELIAAPWRIVYRIAGPTVYVLAVLDGRRNLEDVLLDRLVR